MGESDSRLDRGKTYSIAHLHELHTGVWNLFIWFVAILTCRQTSGELERSCKAFSEADLEIIAIFYDLCLL